MELCIESRAQDFTAKTVRMIVYAKYHFLSSDDSSSRTKKLQEMNSQEDRLADALDNMTDFLREAKRGGEGNCAPRHGRSARGRQEPAEESEEDEDTEDDPQVEDDSSEEDNDDQPSEESPYCSDTDSLFRYTIANEYNRMCEQVPGLDNVESDENEGQMGDLSQEDEYSW